MSGQTDQFLTSSEDFFIFVMHPNMKAFFDSSSTFSSAFNLATSLFHFHEWLFDEFKAPLEAHFGTVFSSKGKFWQAVEGTNAKFGYIRDVANASKHVKIGGAGHPPTSTGMTHVANTHIVSVGYGQGGYGIGRFGGGPNVMLHDGGSQISFDNCADDLFNYWKGLLEQLT